jgi:hypothetical protein
MLWGMSDPLLPDRPITLDELAEAVDVALWLCERRRMALHIRSLSALREEVGQVPDRDERAMPDDRDGAALRPQIAQQVPLPEPMRREPELLADLLERPVLLGEGAGERLHGYATSEKARGGIPVSFSILMASCRPGDFRP